MRRFLIIAMFGGLVGGLGWFFDRHGFNGLEKLNLRSWAKTSPSESEEAPAEPPAPLRIASFKVRGFRPAALEDSRARSVLVEVARTFDVLALQGLDSSASSALAGFIGLVNAGGRHYDFVVGPASGRNGAPRRMAILFDAERVDLDRSALYAVADPDQLLAHPPLVAWFRARGVPTATAWTFSLVVVDSKPSEVEPLAAACRAVRDDGRGEDDLVVAGDFGGPNKEWTALGESARLAPTISGVPTNTVGDRQDANIYYSSAAVEYTGRAGVLDLVRQFNLTVEQALAISDHMPVWAEFASAERDADQFARRSAGQAAAEEIARRPARRR